MKLVFSLRRKYLLNFSVAVALFVFALILSFRVQAITTYVTDLGGIEPNVIYGIQRVTAGQLLYTHPEKPPFAIIQYTPVYYYLCAYTAKVLFSNPVAEVEKLYFTGRSWGVISNLISALLVGYILLRFFSAPPFLALLGLIYSFVFQYAPNYAARPDDLANLWFVLSLLFLLKYLHAAPEQSNTYFRWVSLITCSLFMTCAIFTKQSALITPLVVASFLLLRRDYKGFTISTLSFAVFMGGLYGASYLAFGERFYLNVVDGIDNGIDLLWFSDEVIADKYFLFHLFLLFLVVGYAFSDALWIRNDKAAFLLYASVTIFFFSLIASVKYGSGIHYFVDFQNAALILILYFIGRRTEFKAADGYRDYSFLPVANLIFLPLCLFHTFRAVGILSLSSEYQKQRFEQQRAVGNYLAPLLGKDEYLLVKKSQYVDGNSMIIGLFLPEHHLFPTKDIVECCSFPRNVFSYGQFGSLVSKGQLKFLVVAKGMRVTSFIGFDLNKYKFKVNINEYDIYEWQ